MTQTTYNYYNPTSLVKGDLNFSTDHKIDVIKRTLILKFVHNPPDKETKDQKSALVESS